MIINPEKHWTHKFYETVPIKDENGKPLTGPVPLPEGFWRKSETPLVKAIKDGYKKTRPNS